MLKWLKQSGERQLGPLEAHVLCVVWKRGNATVRELLAEGHVKVAYTTVLTTLDRLFKKGLLDRAPDGRAYRYSPRQTQEEFNKTLFAADVERLLNSARHPAAPISFLVDAVTGHDQALLEELKRTVDRKRRELRRKETP